MSRPTEANHPNVNSSKADGFMNARLQGQAHAIGAVPPKKGLFTASLSVAFVLGAGAFSELLKNSIIAYRLGATQVTDAFFVSVRIVMIVLALWIWAARVAFVPWLSLYVKESNELMCRKMASSLIALTALASLVLAVCGSVFSTPLAHLLTPGFSGSALTMTAYFLRWSSLCLFGVGLAGLGGAILALHEEFILASAGNLVRNAVLIVAVSTLSSVFGANALIIGFFGGISVQALILVPSLLRRRYGLTFDRKHLISTLKPVLLTLTFPLIGQTIRQLAIVVDWVFASYFPSGGITGLFLGQSVVEGLMTVFTMAIFTTLLPDLSQHIDNHNDNAVRLREQLATGIKFVTVILFPAMMLLIFLRNQVAELLYSGSANAYGFTIIPKAIAIYAAGSILNSWSQVLILLFYAQRRLNIVAVHFILMAFNCVIWDMILIRYWGILGIAIAYSFTNLISFVRMWYMSRRSVGQVMNRPLTSYITKIALGSVITATVALLLYSVLAKIVLGDSRMILLLRLVFSSGMGLMLYYAALAFMRLDVKDNVILGFVSAWLKR
jgi:putative peptidoglycan lipid II flippase